jgi:tetratricopeptide (TPR) repeat protein
LITKWEAKTKGVGEITGFEEEDELDEDEKFFSYCWSLFNSLLDQGEINEALESVRKSNIAEYENSDYYYYSFGDNLFKRGKINEALELFRKSLELCNHFKTLERISDCYDMLGLAEPALKYIELAYQANPRNDNTAYKCAEKLKSNNRIAEAKEILESILLRSPSYKKAKILLRILDNGDPSSAK